MEETGSECRTQPTRVKAPAAEALERGILLEKIE